MSSSPCACCIVVITPKWPDGGTRKNDNFSTSYLAPPRIRSKSQYWQNWATSGAFKGRGYCTYWVDNDKEFIYNNGGGPHGSTFTGCWDILDTVNRLTVKSVPCTREYLTCIIRVNTSRQYQPHPRVEPVAGSNPWNTRALTEMGGSEKTSGFSSMFIKLLTQVSLFQG